MFTLDIGWRRGHRGVDLARFIACWSWKAVADLSQAAALSLPETRNFDHFVRASLGLYRFTTSASSTVLQNFPSRFLPNCDLNGTAVLRCYLSLHAEGKRESERSVPSIPSNQHGAGPRPEWHLPSAFPIRYHHKEGAAVGSTQSWKLPLPLLAFHVLPQAPQASSLFLPQVPSSKLSSFSSPSALTHATQPRYFLPEAPSLPPTLYSSCKASLLVYLQRCCCFHCRTTTHRSISLVSAPPILR